MAIKKAAKRCTSSVPGGGPDVKNMDELKRQAALAALDEIRDGMVVGLGTGSTASHFIRELGKRVRDGLHVVAIPTSEASQIDRKSVV